VSQPARFRRNGTITLAALIVFVAGLSVATWAAYLLPLLLVPLAVAVWNWRSGTDADTDGLTVRAALGRRTVPWTSVAGLLPGPGRHVRVELTTGTTMVLPAVTPADLPALIAAAGRPDDPQ
jgi:Bacterial PH domain